MMQFDSRIRKERDCNGGFPDLSPIPQGRQSLACSDGTNGEGAEEESQKVMIPQLPNTSMINNHSRRFSTSLFPIVEEQDENVYNPKTSRRKSIATLFESTRATSLLDQAKRRLSVNDTLRNAIRDEDGDVGFKSTGTQNKNSEVLSSISSHAGTPPERSNSNLPEQHGTPAKSFENKPSKISTPLSVGPDSTNCSAQDGSILVLASTPKTPLSKNRPASPSGSLIVNHTPRSLSKRNVRFALDEVTPKKSPPLELQTLYPRTPVPTVPKEDGVSYSASPDIDEDHPDLQHSISLSSVNLAYGGGQPESDSGSKTFNEGSVKSLQKRPALSDTSSVPDRSILAKTIDSLTPSSIADMQSRSPRTSRGNAEHSPVPSTPLNMSPLTEATGGRERNQFGSMTTVSHNTHVYTPPKHGGETVSFSPGSLNEIERTKVELGVTSSKFIQHVRGASIRRKLHIARSRDSLFEKERQQLQANEENRSESADEAEPPQSADQLGCSHFKARPYPRNASGTAGESGVPKVEKRSTTQPLSPKLGQYRRRESKTPRESTGTSTFKARAVPKSVTSQGDGGMSGVPKIPTRPRTVPASPMLGSRRKPPVMSSLSSTRLVDGSGGYMGVPKVAKRPTTVPESPLLGSRRPISPNKRDNLSLAGLQILPRILPAQAGRINSTEEEDASSETPPRGKYAGQVQPFVPHSTRRAERRATYDVHRNMQEEQRRQEQESRRQAQLLALKRRLETLRKSI